MAQQTAIITGASSGLGMACARELLRREPAWHVVLAVRSVERGRQAVDDLGMPAQCTIAELDLASLASVRRFVEGYPSLAVPPTHAIVCNAGVQIPGAVPAHSADGIELTFAVNHLGHMALVQGLLPMLSTPAQIVVVASDTHDPARRTGMPHPADRTAAELAHPPAGDATPGRCRYTTSKLCNVLYAYELNRRLDEGARGITVNAFNPGLMPGTGLARDGTRLERLAWHAIMPALRVLPQVRGVRTSGRHLADVVTDDSGTTGAYFDGARPARSSQASYDRTRAHDLWTTSDALIGSVTPDDR